MRSGGWAHTSARFFSESSGYRCYHLRLGIVDTLKMLGKFNEETELITTTTNIILLEQHPHHISNLSVFFTTYTSAFVSQGTPHIMNFISRWMRIKRCHPRRSHDIFQDNVREALERWKLRIVEECLNVYWCDFDVERKDYLAHQLLPDLGQRMLFIAIHNKRPRVG